MLYLSKGRFIKRRRKQVAVSIFGSRHVLNEQQSRLWLEGLTGFIEIDERADWLAISQLQKNGLVVLCEKDSGREKYFTLTRCILCPYKKKVAHCYIVKEKNKFYFGSDIKAFD